MRIGLSAIDYDADGARAMDLQNDPASLRASNRRVSRTATLDGGCVVDDMGYAVSDRTMKLEFDISHRLFVAYMTQTYRLIRVCTDEGVFICIPKSFRLAGKMVEITVDVVEQES